MTEGSDQIWCDAARRERSDVVARIERDALSFLAQAVDLSGAMTGHGVVFPTIWTFLSSAQVRLGFLLACGVTALGCGGAPVRNQPARPPAPEAPEPELSVSLPFEAPEIAVRANLEGFSKTKLFAYVEGDLDRLLAEKITCLDRPATHIKELAFGRGERGWFGVERLDAAGASMLDTCIAGKPAPTGDDDVALIRANGFVAVGSRALTEAYSRGVRSRSGLELAADEYAVAILRTGNTSLRGRLRATDAALFIGIEAELPDEQSAAELERILQDVLRTRLPEPVPRGRAALSDAQILRRLRDACGVSRVAKRVAFTIDLVEPPADQSRDIRAAPRLLALLAAQRLDELVQVSDWLRKQLVRAQE